MTAEAMAQMRQLSGLFGGNATARPLDPFSEDEARNMAAKMGEGVTLVSSTPIKTAAGEGRANVFGFRDITKLRLNETPAPPGGSSVRAGGLTVGGDGGTVTIDLERTGGNVRLTLHTSGIADMFVGRSNGAGRPGAASDAAEQLAMVRQMLAGVRLALRVQPAGRLISTSSPYVDGNTVTLFDLDLDELNKKEGAFERLQNAKSKEEAAAVLKDVPGFKLSLERDITIEFAP